MRHLLTIAPLVVLGFAACASSDDPTDSHGAGVGTGRAGESGAGGGAAAAGGSGAAQGGSSGGSGGTSSGGVGGGQPAGGGGAGGHPAGGGGVGGAAGQGGAPGACPTGRGSPMTKITVPGGRTFCIDNRETSQADYAEFLKDSSAWNPSHAPDFCKAETRQPLVDVIGPGNPYGQGCPATVFTPDHTPKRPASCVSWCDALAYCAGAGKRLCQRTDGALLKPKYDDAAIQEVAKAEVSEWFHVCTSGGKYKSTSGGQSAAVACEPPTVPDTFLPDIDVTSPTSCVSPDSEFSGIGYMNGGMGEWMGEPMMDPDKFPGAMAMFSPGQATPPPDDCSRVLTAPAIAKHGSFGIRCCAD